MRIDLYQNTFRSMDIDLQTASLVQRRIKQSEKALFKTNEASTQVHSLSQSTKRT